MDFTNTLKARLSPLRYRHSLEVAAEAVRLAGLHGVDVARAKIAGLLHDYAREIDARELKHLAFEKGLADEGLPVALLHAPVGAYLVASNLGITDEGILSAIRLHTIGGPAMTKLEKVVFLADLTESNRSFPGSGELRGLAEVDLDNALLFAIENTLKYLLEKGGYIDLHSVKARNYLISQKKGVI